MAQYKSTQNGPKAKPTGLVPTGEPPAMDQADGVRVGVEPVPGMRLRCICRGHTRLIGRIAWSPCGRFIASPSSDKTIRIWDAATATCLAVLKGHGGDVTCVAWSPSEVLASGDYDKVCLWDPRFLLNGTSDPRELNDTVLRLRTLQRDAPAFRMSWSPDGIQLAVCGMFVDVPVYSAVTGAQVFTISARGQHVDFDVNDVSWSASGRYIATANSSEATLDVFDARDGSHVQQFAGHFGADVRRVLWFPDGERFASAGEDATIRIWELHRQSPIAVLEGHTRAVADIAISHDGQFLASASYDDTVKIWHVPSHREMTSHKMETFDSSLSVAFNPKTDELAVVVDRDILIHIISPQKAPPRVQSAVYHSAKIVLVGQSNVGKSCLAMRLAEDRYPEAHEHGTTHGMRFWPMEAETLHPSAKSPEGQRRDVVLWDFGGQDEYQLVHQMFLHDTTLALVLIDPTRGQKALDEARDWNKRLEKHLGQRQAVKLLVGTQVDDDKKSGLVNRGAIQALCKECGFAGFYETSALNGRGIDGFPDALADALDWEDLAKTSRPQLFQRIRDEIEILRKTGVIVILIQDLIQRIADVGVELDEYPTERFINYGTEETPVYTRVRDSAEAVTDQLALQGVIVRMKLTGGDEAIVLQLPVLERYAGSLIVAARNNARGVPALETSELGSPIISLPGMTDEDRVPRGQERIVLEAVAELMIEHGLCFRHEGLLVFLTVLKATETARANELLGSVSLYYDFSGAIDNVYASLISWLVIGQGFGRIRLWENRVEFEAEGQGACGLRKVSRGGGFAHLDVYFREGIPTQTQTEFISFV